MNRPADSLSDAALAQAFREVECGNSEAGIYAQRVVKRAAEIAALTPQPPAAGGVCNCKVSVGLASYHEDDCRVMSAAGGVDEVLSVSRARLKALQRGLAMTRVWANGGPVHGCCSDQMQRLGREMAAALSSQPGDYDDAIATPTPAAVPVEELASRFGSEYGTRNGAQPYWDFDRDGLLAFAAAIKAAVPDAVRVDEAMVERACAEFFRPHWPTAAKHNDSHLREQMHAALKAALSAAPESRGDGMLPDALVPHADEWYRLCERRFAVDKITISGPLAEAIVSAISQQDGQP